MIDKNSILIQIIVYSMLLIYTVVVISRIPVTPRSPDSDLYFGLAENIKSGTGYIDNIRNQDILPPVGHPLLLSIFLLFSDNLVLFTRLFIFISLCLLSITTHKALPWKLAGGVSVLLPLLIWKQQVWIAAGVESSVFFINSLLMLSLIDLFTSGKPVKGYKFILTGIVIFLSLIIRPILWPGLLLALLVSIVILIKNRNTKLLKSIVFLLFLPVILYQALGFFSTGIYGDKRMTNGTYSGITLYSAYNEYIDLTRPYGSRLFNDKPEAEVNIDIPDETWQERDSRLKQASIEFVKEHPVRAVRGYIWRLIAFTLNNQYMQYKILILLWVATIIISIRKLKKNLWVIAFSFLLPVYYIGITSVFVYVGVRYLAAMIPILFGSVMLLNRVIFIKFDNKQKDLE